MKIPNFVMTLLGKTKFGGSGSVGNIYGALLAVFATVIRTVSSAIVHGLPTYIPSIQIFFIESVFVLLIFCIIFFKDLGSIIKTNKFFLQVCRAFCKIVGMLFLFSSLKYLPLAISSTLSLSSAVFTVLGSLIFFKEKPNLALFLSIIFSVLGIIFISGFGITDFSYAVFYPILAALSFSFASLLSKKIALFDSLKTSLFLEFFLQVLVTAFFSYFFWEPITFESSVRIFFMSVSILISVPLTLQAEVFSAAAFLAPFKSVRIFFASILGFLFFGERLSSTAWSGIALLISAYFILWRNNNKVISYYIRERSKQSISELEKK